MEISDALHTISCINCLTGERESIALTASPQIKYSPENSEIFIGPGLIDMQINGINGIDFNDINLQPDDLLVAADHLLERGVIAFLPTVITNSKSALIHILSVINTACRRHEILRQRITGIHLEGPFISGEEGARGAHDPRFTCDPDWEYFQELQHASGNRIRLVTLAPERKGSERFIRQCKSAGVAVAIGHSLADANELEKAIKAGATMSTHLGNGVPLMLPRHNNILWEQLAQPDLFAGFIGDGFHLPPSFLKVLLQVKKEKAILVSDATCFAGMPAGEYQTHIGGKIMLDDHGHLSMKEQPGILAGSAVDLLQSIQWLTENKLCPLQEAWACASVHPARYLDISVNEKVIFYIHNKRIHVADIIGIDDNGQNKIL